MKPASATEGDLLGLAVAAHGGADRWAQLSELRLRLGSGALGFASKGRPRALRGLEAVVSTREPRTALVPFPRTGFRGVFEPDVVRIESMDGAPHEERRVPRRAFRGLRHALRWDYVNVLYFAGYALWNYVTAPFLLMRRGVHSQEIEPGASGLRRLAVRFPPDLPTHSPEQVYWFDQRGLIHWLDYTAEVFGRWARAAHHCDGHWQFDGITLATRRRVMPRGPGRRPLPGPTLVWIRLDDIRVT